MMAIQRSNQLSCEATTVESRSIDATLSVRRLSKPSLYRGVNNDILNERGGYVLLAI